MILENHGALHSTSRHKDVLTIGAMGIGIVRAGRGLTPLLREGISNEFRLQYKHIPGTQQAARELRLGAAHLFIDKETLAVVEMAIIERGIETGVIRGTTRYGLRFNNPIGYRISTDGTEFLCTTAS